MGTHGLMSDDITAVVVSLDYTAAGGYAGGPAVGGDAQCALQGPEGRVRLGRGNLMAKGEMPALVANQAFAEGPPSGSLTASSWRSRTMDATTWRRARNQTGEGWKPVDPATMRRSSSDGSVALRPPWAEDASALSGPSS